MIKSNTLTIYTKIKKNQKEATISLYESDDLIHWELKSTVSNKKNIFQFTKINKNKYIKLSFTTDISSISEIVFK